MTAYHDFKEKLTGVDLSQTEKENIILNIVLFGDDKKLLRQEIVWNDASNREGHAAKVYFNALFGLVLHVQRII